MAINYPSIPDYYDPEAVMRAAQRGYQSGVDWKNEKDAKATFGRYLQGLYQGQAAAPTSLAALAPQFSAPGAGTVERAPLPAPTDPATARVEAAFAAQGQPPAGGQGQPSVGEMRQYIAREAAQRGIDPATAIRVAQSEGLGQGIWQSNVTKNGVREPSYGPFQMLVGGGDSGFPEGLGNAFQQQTGLDPADPANWQKTVDFALDTAAKSGWGQWYGAKGAGIGNMQGINAGAAAAPSQQALESLAVGQSAPQGQPVQVADASGAMPQSAGQGGSMLPPREVMAELFANPVTRPLAIQMAQAVQGLRVDANDPEKQLQLQIAQEKLRQLRDPQSKLINAGGGLIYDPNTQRWIQPPEGTGKGGEASLTPVLLKDKDGNLIYGQATKDGRIVRSSVPDGFQPVSPYEKAFETGRGGAEGKGAGGAASALPGAQAVAQQVTEQIDALKNDSYLPKMLGPINSRLPNLSADAARVQGKIDQLQGGAFLQARQMLKGGGAITDYEGAKAEAAFARMSQAQSAEDFNAALDDFNLNVQRGLAKLEEQAGQRRLSDGANTGSAQKRLRFNPATGELE